VKQVDVKLMMPEFDLEKCNLCGICSDVCEFNAIAILGDKPALFSSLCHGCDACYRLCPEEAISRSERTVGKVRIGASHNLDFKSGLLNVGDSTTPPVSRAVKDALSPQRLVIIDAPPGTSCPVVEAVKGCDFVILVTEPTPFGLSDLKLACGMVEALGIPYGVVINRSDTSCRDTADYLKRKQIDPLLEIPFDRRIAENYSAGNLQFLTDQSFRDRMLELREKVLEAVKSCAN
jgi:MinD superfamily P-loop ATPase